MSQDSDPKARSPPARRQVSSASRTHAGPIAARAPNAMGRRNQRFIFTNQTVAETHRGLA